MKNSYLSEFCHEFGYSDSDSSALISAYELIEDDADASACFDSAFNAYSNDVNCDYGMILDCSRLAAEAAGIHKYTSDLLMFISLSRTLRRRYEEKGIPPEIFRDSLLDLKYKLTECKLVKGICGTFVGDWFPGFYRMTRFGLGRLQFETLGFGRSYSSRGLRLTPDSKVINVHIPRTGTPLDKAGCDEAYVRAAEFFAEQVSPIAFVCNSWLLFPANNRMLSPSSNIRRFASEYDIIESGLFNDNGTAWRLFDTEEPDPDKLPADSSLRRAYIGYFKKGGIMGWGFGIRPEKPL